MRWSPLSVLGWLFAESRGTPDLALPRCFFLRALGAIYFSAFFSLVFQIRGLIGPGGISPAGDYLHAVTGTLGHWQRFWYAPTLLWWSSGSVMLIVVCWVGMIGSALLLVNIW